ncbi:MAG: coenzyme F420-0:L-glutamate ligase [Patescibacteria group bacterium]|nr:coenzyme F420-0:L-glutamate ligase [Patescibacteria group bacterium]
MKVTAIHSRAFIPPKDDLYAHLDESLAHVPERAVVAVSSKVVAIGEGRCVASPEGVDPLAFKDTLAEREADLYIPRDPQAKYPCFFAIKNGSFIPSAGIDQSNGNGYFVLWPRDAMESAHDIRAHLGERHGLRELGIIVTDSTSAPLRNGVTGRAIGYAGFHAQYDYRGLPDIFGRPLKSERLNVADSLAAAATLAMGEGDERTPFVLIEDATHVTFAETEADDPLLALFVSLEEDIFAPFLKNAPWRKKKAL